MLIMFLTGLLELFLGRKSRGGDYDIRGALASLGTSVGKTLVKPISGGIGVGVFTLLSPFAPYKLPTSGWGTWVLAFVVVDFASYWMHRWSHMNNWMWANHSVHHSANQIVLPTAARLGWTEALAGTWLMFVPFALLGFDLTMIIVTLKASLAYQFFTHTEMIRSLGPLEWILNTPSHHRAHHSSEPEYLDCNFAACLIIWDRMFGTFVAEPKDRKLRYGLTEPVYSNNPFVIATNQWRILIMNLKHAKGFLQIWDVLFGRPGKLQIERDIGR
jgi:sterol desaturase/sphingolipid hydroxylase (fatty acid hydroxylase superfamily)